MALQISIVNDHEDLLSPFVRNFEFAYVYVGSELGTINATCRKLLWRMYFFSLQLYITENIIAN